MSGLVWPLSDDSPDCDFCSQICILCSQCNVFGVTYWILLGGHSVGTFCTSEPHVLIADLHSLLLFCHRVYHLPQNQLGEAILSHSPVPSVGADAAYELADTGMELEVDDEPTPVHRRHRRHSRENPHRGQDQRVNGAENTVTDGEMQLSGKYSGHGKDGNMGFLARDRSTEAVFDADLDDGGGGSDDEKDSCEESEEDDELVGRRGGAHGRHARKAMSGSRSLGHGNRRSHMARRSRNAMVPSLDGPDRGRGLGAQAGTILVRCHGTRTRVLD